MSHLTDYYVYGYTDPTSSDPYFYIGKGIGRRAYRHLRVLSGRQKSSGGYYWKYA
jgi:hypothetical protein